MAIGLFRYAHGGASPAPRRRLSLRGLFERIRAVPDDARSARLRRLGDVCTVLEGARATLVDDGWVQDTWYAGRDPAGRVPGACLVGAVVRATRRYDPMAGPAESDPALDVLWDALQESRGMGGPGVAGRVAPREIRAARVRDLTRWNDLPGRTREEVLALLDLAASRAIMEAVNQPRVPALPSR